MALVQPITPCLWFDEQAEEAVGLYTAVFPDSRITDVARYGKASHGQFRKYEGKVMTVAFELNGQPFTALNGGPLFKFTEAVSLQVHCETQEEVDHYWERLSAGGDPKAQQCGWLKDRFGLSWQVIPKILIELMKDPNPLKVQRATEAMLKMKKFDIADLKRAVAG
jgi:predicted 3-demethylubiquinone-9 3-methyltransferase (glyoxalase superfamily)